MLFRSVCFGWGSAGSGLRSLRRLGVWRALALRAGRDRVFASKAPFGPVPLPLLRVSRMDLAEVLDAQGSGTGDLGVCVSGGAPRDRACGRSGGSECGELSRCARDGPGVRLQGSLRPSPASAAAAQGQPDGSGGSVGNSGFKGSFKASGSGFRAGSSSGFGRVCGSMPPKANRLRTGPLRKPGGSRRCGRRGDIRRDFGHCGRWTHRERPGP